MILFFAGMPLIFQAQSITTINGQVEGLKDGQKILLMSINKAQQTDTLTQTRCDANGAFKLSCQTSPDIYTLKIANRSIPLLLKGGDQVTITAIIEDFNLVDYTIIGSFYDKEMAAWKSKLDPSTIASYLQGSSENKALFHLFLLRYIQAEVYPDLYQKVLKEIKKSYPKSHHIAILSKILDANQPIPKIGAKAANIKLKNPKGKTLALSKLKGKIVVVDFWASWCRPCRVNNVALKSLYDKYQAQAFEIFSVSLDGNGQLMEQKKWTKQQQKDFQNAEREKWKKAIKADQLSWKCHVSELLGWDSPITQTYAVNELPMNFVLDKKGIIRYINIHGEELDRRIGELLLE